MSQHQEVAFTSLSDVFSALWNNKVKLILAAIAGTILGIIIAFTMPEKYRSIATLFPSSNNSSGNLSGLAGQLGGLASIAGVDLGGGDNDNTVLAIEVVNSHQFISSFIKNNALQVPLFALSGYDFNEQRAQIDATIYNDEQQQWLRDPDVLGNTTPNDFELVKEFQKNFEISQDKVTAMVTVSFDSPSPEVAQRVVENVIVTINKTIRERDIKQAQESIEYLKEELANTNVFEMRKMFSQLIEEQTSKLMLAKVKTDYVFEVIDPPLSTLKPHSPNKPLIIIVMMLLGGLCMVSYILLFKMPLQRS